MPAEQLWLFITITLVLSASPGPVMLACMIDAGRYGIGKSVYTMLGASAGNLALMLLSALGLGLLVEEAEAVFHTIKWIGAAYLVYLGIQLLRAPPLSADMYARNVRSHHLFGKAFMVAVTNPKGLVYFGALFPQFIDINKSMPPQFTLLTVIFLLMDLIWMTVYAVGGHSIMRWLKSPEHQRWFNWISGGALILAGGALAFTKL
ncbi:LysE family translocator [Cellvibrio sp. pealriver]|uniref:LysE family translocator n=1 Tax=Cellvibrio sp. pealriver TaxID=1622269 RepID=UPI00066FB585|nr:LysE family translocator [Cellvibrio sp. pealriver]